MALSVLSGSMGVTFKWNAENNLTGSAYNPVQNTGAISKQQTFVSTADPDDPGGANEVVSFQQSIAAGATATINLATMTNLLQQASVTIARVKGFMIRLLSATDDATITPAPTATSTATVTNLAVTCPSPLLFAQGGSGLTITTTVSGGAVATVAIGVAGTGYLKSAVFLVNIVEATGTGASALVTTNASGVPTAVALGAAGTGYTATTLPTNVAGTFNLYTGGAKAYFDPSGAGPFLVSATQKNFKVQNNDATNAITVEVSVFGGAA